MFPVPALPRPVRYPYLIILFRPVKSGPACETDGSAADNCGADWNEQAAKTAQSHVDLLALSRDELLSQLEYEGFTTEQALYGVAAVGY